MASENEDGLARSQRFDALYNDATMRELLEGTLGDLYRQWLTSEPGDAVGRERMYLTALAVRSLKSRLDVEREPAKMREATLRMQREQEEAARREADGGPA